MFGVKEREKKPRKATVSFKKLLLIIECVQRKEQINAIMDAYA